MKLNIITAILRRFLPIKCEFEKLKYLLTKKLLIKNELNDY